MEFLAVFGGISAAASIIGEMEVCSTNLRRLYHDLRYAKEEVKLLRLQVSGCRNLTTMFHEITKSVQTRVTQVGRNRKLDRCIRQQSAMAREQIDGLLEKLEPLRKDSDATRFQKSMARIQWYLNKDDILLPLKTLESVKASLSLWSTLLLLDQNIFNVSKIAETDIEGRRQLLTEIKHLKRQLRSAERDLNQSISDMKEILCQNTDHPQDPCVTNLVDISDSIQLMEDEPIAQARQLLREIQPSSSSSSWRTRPSGSSGPLTPSSSQSRSSSSNLLSPSFPRRDFSHATRPPSVTMPSENRSLVLYRRKDRSRVISPEPQPSPPSDSSMERSMRPTTDIAISNRRSQTSSQPDSQLQPGTRDENEPNTRSTASHHGYHDYGDGSREEYMREHSATDDDDSEDEDFEHESDSSSPPNQPAGPGMFVPLAPFGPPIPQQLPEGKRKKRNEEDS